MAEDTQDISEVAEDEFLKTLVVFSRSDEFKIYKRILESQIKARQNKLLEMAIFDQASMAEANILKGEILGLQTAMLLPSRAFKKVEDDKLLADYYKLFEKEGETNGRSDT